MPHRGPFAIERMTLADVVPLAALLQNSRSEYLAHFRPFPFDRESLAAELSAARKDRFWIMRAETEVVGFCMLRGWDRGFARPSFGVVIGERHAGKGGARQALDFAIQYCRSNEVQCLMLSVHPGNKAALRVYESAGFTRTAEKTPAGYDIYELQL